MKRSTGLVLSLAMLLSACQSAGSTIKIGFIGPLTGNIAGVGNDTLNGIHMAVEAINAKGGINGKQIEIVAEDGKCGSAEAASAAQKLISVDKVVAILGGQCSGETLAAAPIAEAAKIVLLSSLSSSPDVTTAGDYVFRNYPSDALKTKSMVEYFTSHGFKKVAMINSNSDFSQAFRDSLVKDLANSGVEIVFNESIDAEAKDFRSLLTRLKGMDFDVFFPNISNDSGMAVIMQQFRDQSFTQQAVSHDYADVATIADTAGKAVEGMHIINVPTLGAGTDFEKNFTAEYGAPKAGIAWAALGHDAAYVLANTIGAAKDGDIHTMLYKAKHVGVTGTFSFDKNGDVVGLGYVLKTFKDGKIVELGPVTTK